MMIRIPHLIFLCLLLSLLVPKPAEALEQSLRTSKIDVLYEDTSRAIADEVVTIFPDVLDSLGKSLLWEPDFRPRIVLLRDRDAFVRAAGSQLFLAYAVPQRQLIVIDASRVYSKPFTLETTLKHEMCHLLLHRFIAESSLPRWLDEGICQWASGGISELLATNGRSALAKAVARGSLRSLEDLEVFPRDEAGIILAYEQSKSFIEYIRIRYGHDGILRILARARAGYPVEESIRRSLSVSLAELEQMWQAHLGETHSLFSYLSSNLYTILFLLAGLMTIYGFIRVLKRKKDYADEEEGDAF